MTIETSTDAAHLRSRLAMFSRQADKAFESAFDLQQAGAPSHRIDAALAEVERLQAAVRSLQAQLPDAATVH